MSIKPEQDPSLALAAELDIVRRRNEPHPAERGPNIAFFFLALVFMYVGRKLGWALSRGLLYGSPKFVAVVGCVVWGVVVAISIQALIRWQQPGFFLKAIMGYALGSYVAVPKFGLVNESTIPEHAAPRHHLISALPVLVYIAASLAAAFLL